MITTIVTRIIAIQAIIVTTIIIEILVIIIIRILVLRITAHPEAAWRILVTPTARMSRCRPRRTRTAVKCAFGAMLLDMSYSLNSLKGVYIGNYIGFRLEGLNSLTRII